jgi:large subunit ribosomal protein L25
MSMAEQMVVENRDQRGKLDNRRLRKSGKIPAVLYGHGLENVCLAVSSEALSLALRHGSRLVDLTGAVSESAFIRDMQWDTGVRMSCTSISPASRPTK